MDYVTFDTILATTNRLSFDNNELKVVIEGVKARRERGTDLCMGDPVLTPEWDAVKKAAENGVVFLHSPEMLRKRFAFVKVNAGRGLFGRQKAAFNWYLGDLDHDDWTAGGVATNWAMAVTSIGNVYRFEGYR